MDIYEYLKLDHEHVNQLFKQFEKSKDPVRQVQIITFLAQELLIHAKSEQETFYKALEHHLDSREEAMHGKKEHAEIEAQIRLVLETPKADAQWHKKVKKLKELVTHHVDDEEGKMFKRAKEVLTENEACIIKEHMHFLKQKLLRNLEKVSDEA